jgi:alkylation response protein AidB-like acyl-CoA dehydrogenase
MVSPLPSEPPTVEEADALAVLVPELRRFLRSEVDSAAIDREGAIPAAVRSRLADIGLFGVTLPAAYGGAGLSLGAGCRVVAEIARVDRSVAILVGLHAGLGTRGLVQLGTPSLRARWLPALASGRCIAAFGATEAGAGSALTGVRTTGQLVDGQLRVDGEKSYVTNGAFAGLFTVLARTPGLGGERAHSLVCIPGDTPGLRRGAEEKKLGIRGSSTVTVSFEDVRVPLDHVLGIPGRGMEQANGLLAWGRTLLSAGCVGTAQGALEATVAYVQERRQFGSPIGDFAATRAHVAWMAARTYAMEAVVREASDASQRDETYFESASAVAKVFCSEGAFDVCDRAIQLHGALGFLEDTGVSRMLRDTRVTRIFEGANDVLLLRIGTATLAHARRKEPMRADALPLGAEVQRLDRAIDDAVHQLRERLGVGAVRHQLALQALARAVICASAARASLDSATVTDVSVARHAVRLLVDEGTDWLSRITRADADEAQVRAVTDDVYAR